VALSAKTSVFGEVTPCSLVGIYRHFRRVFSSIIVRICDVGNRILWDVTSLLSNCRASHYKIHNLYSLSILGLPSRIVSEDRCHL
jgi:hypothetical protein